MLTEYLLKRREIMLGIRPPDENKPPKKISIKSVKRMAEEKLYLKKKKEYLTAHIRCEVKGCNKVSESLHHKKGRIGNLLYNERFFMGVCLEHHRKIEDFPEWAIKEGYSFLRLKK